MSVIPYLDALVISGATMLLLHRRSFDYLSTYTASPLWTIFVIGVIIWCVSFHYNRTSSEMALRTAGSSGSLRVSHLDLRRESGRVSYRTTLHRLFDASRTDPGKK